MKFTQSAYFLDIIALVIQFTGLLCSLPFITLAFMAGLSNKGCTPSLTATHVFSALTALWLVVLGTGLVLVKIKGWISVIPFIPYASFVCYFVLAVIAYAIKNVLIAKIAGGTFGFSVLLLMTLSVYVSVSLGIRSTQFLQQMKEAVAKAQDQAQNQVQPFFQQIQGAIAQAQAQAQNQVEPFLKQIQGAIAQAQAHQFQPIFQQMKEEIAEAQAQNPFQLNDDTRAP